MAKRKSPKKTTKQTKKTTRRSVESRTLSFFIGVITVTLIALAILGIAQGKNYKSVLGTHTSVENSR